MSLQIEKLNANLYDQQFVDNVLRLSKTLTEGNTLELECEPYRESEFVRSQVIFLTYKNCRFIFFVIKSDVSTKQNVDEYYQRNLEYEALPKSRGSIEMTIQWFENVDKAAYLQAKGVQLIKNAKQLFLQSRCVLVFKNPLLAGMVKLLAEIASDHGDATHNYVVQSSMESAWQYIFGEVEKIISTC